MAPTPVLLQILLCALLWGAAFPLIKRTYAEWPETTLAVCLFFAGARFALAGAGLLALCREPLTRLRRANKKLLLSFTLTQTFIQYCFFYTGMAISSGVLGALLVACGSCWWILLGPILLGTPHASRRDWQALGICAVGIVLAVWAPGAGSGRVLLGSLCFLIASLAGALALITMRPLSESLDARSATGFSLFFGGLLLLGAGAAGAPAFVASLTPTIVLYTLALAFISAVSFSIWNRLAHQHSINLLANYRFLIPLSGAVQSTLFIQSEFPGPGLLAGGFLILGALHWLGRPGSSGAASRP